jgi:hypothetical protein
MVKLVVTSLPVEGRQDRSDLLPSVPPAGLTFKEARGFRAAELPDPILGN